MIQLLILFFVVVFIIAIIMLYKKYIRIKNVVDEELDRKYNNVKKAVGSNNKQIKQLKKDASELINKPNNDTNTLQEKINNNRDKIAENRVEMVDNNFQEINKVFKYESGFIVGGNAGQLRIGSDNIQLNVPNPVQVRVCDEQSCDSDIFTKRNTEDSIPLVINENVDSGVDESENGNIGSNVPVVTYNNDQKKLEFSIGVNSVNISGDETSIFAVQSYDGWDRINSESYTTTDNDQLQNEISLIFYTAPNKKLTLGILNRDENGVLIEDNDGIYTSTTFEYNLGGTKDDVTVTPVL